jgi:ferritin-like metal-binding protein YciE
MKNEFNLLILHNLLDYDSSRYISAEMQFKNSLPCWINQAGSAELRTLMLKYLNMVQQHIFKIKKESDAGKLSAISLTNGLMRTYIEEADEKLIYCQGTEKDACLLACLQHINRYKISKYAVAATFANALEVEEVVDLFLEMEADEKIFYDQLLQLTKYQINMMSVAW